MTAGATRSTAGSVLRTSASLLARSANASARLNLLHSPSGRFNAFSVGPHPASFFTEAAEVEGSGQNGGLLIKEEHTLWPLLASDGHTAALLQFSSGNRVGAPSSFSRLTPSE